MIRVHNDSAVDLAANTNGQINGTVVHPDTGQRVGCYEGAQSMPLVRFDVPPGSTSEIPLLIGTASTKPELGWAVPPGPWAVRTRALARRRRAPCASSRSKSSPDGDPPAAQQSVRLQFREYTGTRVTLGAPPFPSSALTASMAKTSPWVREVMGLLA